MQGVRRSIQGDIGTCPTYVGLLRLTEHKFESKGESGVLQGRSRD